MPINASPSLIWFRQDLRLDDNPALMAAIKRGAPLIPVYIRTDGISNNWSIGATSRVWLHQSLIALKAELEECGSSLIIRQGDELEVLIELIKETGAGALFWNKRYEPIVKDVDANIHNKLANTFKNVLIGTFNASLLYEPSEIKQKNNRPYQVFTAFWRACALYGEPLPPCGQPMKLIHPINWPKSISLEQLGLMSGVNWADQIMNSWTAGSSAAQAHLQYFIYNALCEYKSGRDRPDLDLVSKLSPYLHLGQISPRQVYHAIKCAMYTNNDQSYIDSCQTYLKEIGWREFAYHLLFHFPRTTDEPLRVKYANFPWSVNDVYWKAWCKGETGYPIVDAGMRQLWQIGWMHNRVRMIVASFLVKDLLIPWQHGAHWFWDTLIDADLANNTLGWQWAAGCGADAAPYFRIFNPITQGQKFDPDGQYIRRFLPELKNVPVKYIHAPWLADEEVLKKAKVKLGITYPSPIVNHAEARLKALAALAKMSKDRSINEET